MTSHSSDEYKAAGVDLDEAQRLIAAIAPFIKETARSGADADIGGFGGTFDLRAAGYQNPILVATNDGVGTKVKIAIKAGKHGTIGQDLVAMCVNDLVVQGAEPLFLLDYYATGVLQASVGTEIIVGIVRACQMAGCALLGGETAEMPGLYRNSDYDLAGFAVGAVERGHLLPKLANIKAGDEMVGMGSDGLHSNGFSLVRKLVRRHNINYADPVPASFAATPGQTWDEFLLTPTRLYVQPCLELVRRGVVKSFAHVTGGGLVDNIPRALPEHLGAELKEHWPRSPVFDWLEHDCGITRDGMRSTFNCGIGMVAVVDEKSLTKTMLLLKSIGEQPYHIGTVTDVPGVYFNSRSQ